MDVPQTVAPGPLDIRGLSAALVAIVALVFLLQFAWETLLPVALAALISYAFDPIVSWLARIRVPRAIGSALVLGVFVGGISYGCYSLTDDALGVVEDLPAAAQKLRRSMRAMRGDESGAMATLTEAAVEIGKAAAEGTVPTPARPGVTRVQVEEKPFDVVQYFWWGSMGVMGLAGRGVMVIFLAFFLLSSGDLYRRKLIKIVGPLSRQKVTVQILDEITAQIERFLLVQMTTSVVVAVASTLAFVWIGLERPLLWGIAAGLLNSIPYFGPLIVMGGIAVVAYVQFGAFDKTLQVAGLSLVITSLEGFLLTPWLLGRTGRMNPAAVFVGLLFWGGVWGVWGMLLAAPLMMVLKTVCDRVEGFRGLGEMLGD